MQRGHNASPTTMASHGHKGNSHQGHSGSDFMNGHHMFFHVRDNIPVIFESWRISSVEAMVFTCLGVFVVALLFEMMKTWRNRLQSRQVRHDNRSSVVMSDVPTELGKGKQAFDISATPSSHESRCSQILSPLHLLQTSLHMLQVFIGYLLMLVAMTFNVWLFVSVVVGAAAGYFLSAAIAKEDVRSQRPNNNEQPPSFQLTSGAAYGNPGFQS